MIGELLNGLGGPIRVSGESDDGEMPAVSMSHEDVAAVMTYVRRGWDHGADPVDPATVREVAEETRDRGGPWTVAELEAWLRAHPRV